MSADTVFELDDDATISGYVAQRSFTFNGKAFRPGDPITMAVFKHPRFSALLGSGYVREARP